MRTIKQLIVRKVKSPKPFKLKIQNYNNPKTKTKNAQRQHRFFGTLGQKVG